MVTEIQLVQTCKVNEMCGISLYQKDDRPGQPQKFIAKMGQAE